MIISGYISNDLGDGDILDPKGMTFPQNVPVYYNHQKVGVAKLIENADETGIHTEIQFDKGKVPLELLNNDKFNYGLGCSISGGEMKLNEVSLIKKDGQ